MAVKYRLLEDILSYNRKAKPYGLQSEIVTEIADYDNMLIVEDKKGNRFPVLKTKVKQIVTT